jgi:hypothetical protein
MSHSRAVLTISAAREFLRVGCRSLEPDALGQTGEVIAPADAVGRGRAVVVRDEARPLVQAKSLLQAHPR